MLIALGVEYLARIAYITCIRQESGLGRLMHETLHFNGGRFKKMTSDNNTKQDESSKKWWSADFLYDSFGPVAEFIKTAAQMSIGVVLALALLLRGFAYLSENLVLHWFWAMPLYEVKPLKMVGDALMLSAGFELAYMLFTRGPDEAIEPLILGAAATALIVVSDEPFDIAKAAVLLLIIFSVGILFYVKERFMKDRKL